MVVYILKEVFVDPAIDLLPLAVPERASHDGDKACSPECEIGVASLELDPRHVEVIRVDKKGETKLARFITSSPVESLPSSHERDEDSREHEISRLGHDQEIDITLFMGHTESGAIDETECFDPGEVAPVSLPPFFDHFKISPFSITWDSTDSHTVLDFGDFFDIIHTQFVSINPQKAMAYEYYDLLGVSRSASADEIKKAYRKKAMEYHPDRTGGDKEKEAKFKEINEAYQTLSDPQKKSYYDQVGTPPGAQ